ncbi:hypothetical protein [Meiothermus granaticius]|uniref:DUF4286 family protein n=1 Tax=Meiothermus granaticius NBRC 107808 TaxID=1227551 RepID=A0A399FES7_9DEIN|nr:hypothetical protein [Meiothermus granaticius]MCL6527581.1 hypothetical protein [Thermaceae bacterium]RIH93652.1 hypothetical protein Mgrana_00476 [Meiothermus granaticius NBRC 107808]GEM86814.1 hypothetical protein MGR01S_14390 [Meiothermus granaticius NBRC 107808]
MTKRRYEVLLPIRHNDGRSILVQDTQTLQQTLRDVIERFGAMSYSPNSILGVWRSEDGRPYDDDLFLLTVDVEDTPENREFFRRFKGVLRERFQQREIYMVTYLLEVI